MSGDEFVPFAPDIPGQTRRKNHNSPRCNGSSESMVIKRKLDGSITAKCFRCGDFGEAQANKPSAFKPDIPLKSISYELPKDLVYKWHEMPVQVVSYLNQFFTEGALVPYKIGWSPRLQRLIFPIYNTHGKFVGWQGKSWVDDTPRYITRSEFPKEMFVNTGGPRDSVIIVEDFLSSIKASWVCASFALLGTELNHLMLRHLAEYRKRYTWLDNDNSIVKKKQLDIHHRLSMYGESILVKSKYEPKELTKEQIQDTLNSADKMVL